MRTCLASCIDMHGWGLTKGTKDNAKIHLWGLLARRMCYDRNYSSDTGKWPRVKMIAYEMHIEIFNALRPLWFNETKREKKKAWWWCIWERLPVPFQKFLDSEHEGIKECFSHDYDIDTDAIYSSLRGDKTAT